VCEREREIRGEREIECVLKRGRDSVCVEERVREREMVFVCMCVCVRGRERSPLPSPCLSRTFTFVGNRQQLTNVLTQILT